LREGNGLREHLRVIAFTIAVLGGLLALMSMFADPLALGVPGSGFGAKQLAGVLLGVGLIGIAGLIWRRAT
jgi:hypothetical protein